MRRERHIKISDLMRAKVAWYTTGNDNLAAVTEIFEQI